MAEAEFVAKVRAEGADEAAADLEGVADAGAAIEEVDPNVEVAVDDEATPVLDEVTTGVEGLDGTTATASVVVHADDDASTVISEVAEEVAAVDRAEGTAQLKATSDTVPISEFTDLVSGVSTTAATAHMQAEGDEKPIVEFKDKVGEVDNIESVATLTAQADTTVVDEFVEKVNAVDGGTSTSTLEADAETGEVDTFTSALDMVPDQTKTDLSVEGGEEANSSVLDLTANVSTASGVFSELGVTGSKQMGLIAKVTSKASLGAIAAFTAVGAAAKNALDDYVKLATGVDKSAKAVGMATEDYSRWVSAVDNVGVSQGQLTAAFVAMNRTLKSNSAAYEENGIAIKDQSGAARDSGEVMLDVMGAIAATEGVTAKAATATSLLGRGYKNLGPLLGMTESAMRDWLSSVSDAQVITEQEAEAAYDMQIAQDALADSMMDVKLAIGKLLLELEPLITGLADALGAVSEIIGPLAELAGGLIETAQAGREAGQSLEHGGKLFSSLGDMFSAFGDSAKNMVGAIKDVTTAEGDSQSATEASIDAAGRRVASMEAEGKGITFIEAALLKQGYSEEVVAKAMDEAGISAEELATQKKKEGAAAKESDEANKALTDTLQGEIEAVQELIAAEQERIDAMRAQADSTFALTDAQVDFDKALGEHAEATKEAKGDTLLLQQANNELAGSAAGVADALVQVQQDQAAAKGETLSAADAADTWNASMLRQAQAAGSAGGAVVDYIANVNGIPSDVTTLIKALVNQGDIGAAEALIAEVSRNRESRVNVDANTALAEAATKAYQLSVETGIPLQVLIDADPTLANAQAAGVKANINTTTGTVTIDGNKAPADAKTAEAKENADTTTGTIAVDANKAKADKIISDVEKGDYSSLVEVDASGLLALAVILAITSAKRKTTIDVEANTSPAIAAINRVTQGKHTATVDAVIGSVPSSSAIASRIGPVKVPVDYYTRTEPRVTGARA